MFGIIVELWLINMTTSGLLFEVPDWWQEGDHVLGVALVAAKATEIRMSETLTRHPNDQVMGAMYERAKLRSLRLERAVLEWKRHGTECGDNSG